MDARVVFTNPLPSATVRDKLLRLLQSIGDGNLTGTIGELRVAAVLDGIAIEALHDVYLPDGRTGRRWTQIDHLVLTAGSILVVETKNYGGRIYASQFDRTWTHWIGGKKPSFQNPIRQNHLHIQAVLALAPGVRVLGRVVFTDRAKFGKEMPQGVSMLSDLRRDLREELGIEPGVASRDLLDAWETIKANIDRSPEARKAHLDDLHERFGPSERPEPEIQFDDVLDALEAAQRRTGGPATAETMHPKKIPNRFGPKSRPAFAWGRLVGSVVGFGLLAWLALALPKLLALAPGRTPASVSAAPVPRPTGPSVAPSVAPTWIPLRPITPSPPTRAASAPAPSQPTPAIPVGPQKYLVRSEPPPSPQEAATQACNTAIAGLLIDNSHENRAARDVACSKAGLGTMGSP